ncbi:MAG: peroxidase-related enzyme [Rhodovarius sp.]|nr:peroxidase-related enzyme [Rhodovarius sp.]
MTDLIDRLLGIAPGSPLDRLRALRPELRSAGAGAEAAIFDGPSALTGAERHAVAAEVARRNACAVLAEHHGAHAAGAEESPRLPVLLAHARLLTDHPDQASRAALSALLEAGLGVREIVLLSQLIAYVNYQVRMMRALRLLGPGAEQGEAEPHRVPIAGAAASGGFGFTMEPLEWRAWLPCLNLSQASADQLRILEESHPKAKTSDYYLLLAQEPEVLRQRSILFNTIMYGPRGASRADRELAAAAESRFNGCPYCLSVHAQRYVQLKGDPELMARLVEQGVEAPMDPRSRAIVDLAVKLSATPPAAGVADVERLRGFGLGDAELLDIMAAVAMFAWANRLMQSLGEPVRP